MTATEAVSQAQPHHGYGAGQDIATTVRSLGQDAGDSTPHAA